MFKKKQTDVTLQREFKIIAKPIIKLQLQHYTRVGQVKKQIKLNALTVREK